MGIFMRWSIGCFMIDGYITQSIFLYLTYWMDIKIMKVIHIGFWDLLSF